MHPPVLEDVVKGRPQMRKDDVMDATVTAQGNGPGEHSTTGDGWRWCFMGRPPISQRLLLP
jgi:hypothetical protein